MSKTKEFKPVFKGFMKMYLHDDVPEFLHYRAKFEGQWVQSRRHRILKKERVFSIRLHIFDVDGNKRGHEVFELSSAGGQSAISSSIFKQGNALVDEIRAEHPDAVIDLVNSYAVVRA